MTEANSKRLLKNSLFLYFRMGIIMLLTLYSSRLLLKNLGVDDYGIYNLVGSIISMVQMIKVLFVSSVQRFLNYEMGLGNQDRLQQVFNMGIIANVFIAVIFVILVECLGLWFFEYKINIDPSRVYVAKWVFHISVLSTLIMIISSPYDAAIIAHEKMFFFSFISVVYAFLRFIGILLIPLFSIDQLIFYAIYLLFVEVLNRIVNLVYCKKHFIETHYKFFWDSSLFKEMFSFAGWQFFGNAAYTLTQNGLNMMLNVFGGPVVNAARGFAYQVNTAIGQFLNSVLTALNPFVTKTYSQGNKEKVFAITFFSSKVLFMISYLLVIPILFFSYEILVLWLSIVPQYTVEFVKLVVIWGLIRSLHSPIDNLIKAEGRIKFYQLTEGFLLAMPLVASYIALKQQLPMYSVFICVIVFELINLVAILNITQRLTGLKCLRYFISVGVPCILLCIMATVAYIVRPSDVISRGCLAFIVDFIALIFMWRFGLTHEEKGYCRIVLKCKK